MRQLGDLTDGRYETGHVGCAAYCDEADLAGVSLELVVDPRRGRAAVHRHGQVDSGEVLTPLSGVRGGQSRLNLTPSPAQVESVSFTLARALSMVLLTRDVA